MLLKVSNKNHITESYSDAILLDLAEDVFLYSYIQFEKLPQSPNTFYWLEMIAFLLCAPFITMLKSHQVNGQLALVPGLNACSSSECQAIIAVGLLCLIARTSTIIYTIMYSKIRLEILSASNVWAQQDVPTSTSEVNINLHEEQISCSFQMSLKLLLIMFKQIMK